jgi:hypothetical protein
LRSDSGEISLDRLPSDLTLRASSARWTGVSLSEDELDLRLKSFRGENLQAEDGDSDLAERL